MNALPSPSSRLHGEVTRGQRRVHGLGGNLHQIRHFGPDQGGADGLPG